MHKPEKWVCENCTEEEKKARNCDGDPKRKDFTFPFHPKLPSTWVNMCPRAFIDPHMEFFFEQFMLWKRLGALPRGGGFEDQDAKLVEAFNVIQSALDKHAKIEEEKAKHEEEERKRKAQGLTGGKRPQTGNRGRLS